MRGKNKQTCPHSNVKQWYNRGEIEYRKFIIWAKCEIPEPNDVMELCEEETILQQAKQTKRTIYNFMPEGVYVEGDKQERKN